MKRFYILDREEMCLDDGDVSVFVCRGANGKTRTLCVRKSPLIVYVAARDVKSLYRDLTCFIRSNLPGCCGDDCECMGGPCDVPMYPCGRKMTNSAFFLVSEKRHGPYIELVFSSAFFMSIAAKHISDMYHLMENKKGIKEWQPRIKRGDWIEVEEGAFEYLYADIHLVSGPSIPRTYMYIHVTRAKKEAVSGMKDTDTSVISTVFVDNDQRVIRSFMLAHPGKNPRYMQTLYYRWESELLTAFCHYILDKDPDVLVGYSFTRDVIRYLIRRADYLGLIEFRCFSRIPRVPVIVQFGTYLHHVDMRVRCPGRECVDIGDGLRARYKLGSYDERTVSGVLGIKCYMESLSEMDIWRYTRGSLEHRVLVLENSQEAVLFTVGVAEKESQYNHE